MAASLERPGRCGLCIGLGLNRRPAPLCGRCDAASRGHLGAYLLVVRQAGRYRPSQSGGVAGGCAPAVVGCACLPPSRPSSLLCAANALHGLGPELRRSGAEWRLYPTHRARMAPELSPVGECVGVLIWCASFGAPCVFGSAACCGRCVAARAPLVPGGLRQAGAPPVRRAGRALPGRCRRRVRAGVHRDRAAHQPL